MRLHSLHAILASAVILCSAALAHAMIPKEFMAAAWGSLDLDKVVPKQFGRWKLVPNIALIKPAELETLDRKIYSKELGLGYKDPDGHIVMLLVAYGPKQEYGLTLHRPEICYPAAGFRISHLLSAKFPYRDGAPPLKVIRLVAQRGPRFEPITYWMRVGSKIASGFFDSKIVRWEYGLRGVVPDGVLVRVSTLGLRQNSAYEIQEEFIRDLLGDLPPRYRRFFVGDPD